jgi:monofunctional biosynthetic peptidoglycan transglycosylase
MKPARREEEWGPLDVSSEQSIDEDEPLRARTGGSRGVRSLLRRIVLIAVALMLLPYLLTLIYAVPFIRPVSTLMLADLALLRGYDRQWVSFDDISPNLVRSVMMSEDGQFCAHGGVDWGEMRHVVQDALDGETTRGASTIPMQTAKNLFLWNGRSFVRKGLELPLAIAADFVWSKRRMMEIYLNVAEWGPGIYGAEAAARHHFGVSASKLSRQQAALLAVSLPNPRQRIAGKPGRGMRRLAALVERRARNSGDYIKCLYD